MILNPFYTAVGIYFLFSAISFINGLNNGGFYLLGNFNHIEMQSYWFSFLVDAFFIFVLLLIYRVYYRHLKCKPISFTLDSKWGWGIVVHQLLYILFVILTGAGVAGSGFSFGGFNVFNYYFIAFSPDMLAFIILPHLASSKQFYFGASIMLASYLLRGWLGGFIFLFFIILIRYYPIRLRLKTIIEIIFVSLVVLISLPILEGIKWGRRLGLSFVEIISMAVQDISFDAYFLVFESMANRLSHLNYSALIYGNIDLVRHAYEKNGFKEFWQHGLLYETYCRIFDNCKIDFNSFVVKELIDPYGKDWNLDVGISGWFSLLGFDFIYFALFLMFFLLCCRQVLKSRMDHMSLNLVFVFSMIYLFHGWLSPYYNFLLYILAFGLIVRIRNFAARKMAISRQEPPISL